MADPQPHDDAKEELDPELVKLRGSRGGIGPILALSVLGFAAFLMITLRADFSFSLRGKAVVDAGPATGQQWTNLASDYYVTIRGVPDVARAARLRGSQDTGHRLVPLRGTGSRVWIHIEGEATNVTPSYEDAYVGRLRKIASTAFASDLKTYLATRPPEPRYVFPEAMAAGLPDKDVLGDPLVVAPDTKVVVSEKVPGVARVTVVQTPETPDADAAMKALVAAGVLPGSAAPVEASDKSWTFESPMPPDADLAAKLKTAKLYAVSIGPKVVSHDGTGKDLSVGGGEVKLAGQTIPLANVDRLVVYTRTQLPSDAAILLEGESPGDYWYVPWLFGVLGVVSLFMLWALARQLVPRK